MRENDLEQRHVEFINDHQAKSRFFEGLGIPPTDDTSLHISLFSYENVAVIPLLTAWATGSWPITCLASPTRNRGDLERFAGRDLRVGDTVRKENLTLHT